MFIQKFLHNREFSVRLGSVQSNTVEQEMGVPQECILFVTLFSLKINSISKCLPTDIHRCLFVDDFIIYSSSNMALAERRIQLALNKVILWADKNDFRFSQQKTVCMDFCNLRGIHPPPSLTIAGRGIPTVDEVRFLGLVFDRKLTFRSHIRQLKEASSRKMNVLKVVGKMSCGQTGKPFLNCIGHLFDPSLTMPAQSMGQLAPLTSKHSTPFTTKESV
jgi:hypothetical protein